MTPATRTRLAVPLLFLAFVAGECGPSVSDLGRNALLVAPFGVVATGLLLAGLSALWRRREPAARLRALSIAAPAALTTAVAGLLLPVTDTSWFWITLVFAGSAQLLIGLLAWRLFFFRRKATAFHIAPLVGLLALAPAVPMALGGFDGTSTFEYVVDGWLVAGFWGIPAGGVAIVLFVEALIRRRKR